MIGRGCAVQLLRADGILSGDSLERVAGAGARLLGIREFLHQRFHLRALVGIIRQLAKEVLIPGHQGLELAFTQALRPVDQGDDFGALQQLPFGTGSRFARLQCDQNAVAGGDQNGRNFRAVGNRQLQVHGIPNESRPRRNLSHRFQGQRLASRKRPHRELERSQCSASRAAGRHCGGRRFRSD